MAVSAVTPAGVQHGTQHRQVDMTDPMILAMVCITLLPFVEISRGVA